MRCVVAEASSCFHFRVVARHAVRHQLVDAPFDVEAEFGVDVGAHATKPVESGTRDGDRASREGS